MDTSHPPTHETHPRLLSAKFIQDDHGTRYILTFEVVFGTKRCVFCASNYGALMFSLLFQFWDVLLAIPEKPGEIQTPSHLLSQSFFHSQQCVSNSEIPAVQVTNGFISEHQRDKTQHNKHQEKKLQVLAHILHPPRRFRFNFHTRNNSPEITVRLSQGVCHQETKTINDHQKLFISDRYSHLSASSHTQVILTVLGRSAELEQHGLEVVNLAMCGYFTNKSI